ncbi:MAG: thiamine-phosphate kinase [Deltaproteobacteria bacterium]|nr:thiamine-phosphate kinase [Deltaproteobacteria bacterium]
MLKKEKLSETRLIKEIELLSSETQSFNKSLIIKSIGDDCAIIQDKNVMLVSSDSITENVHFNFDLYNFYEIGEKTLLVNLSDIAAMGGIPRLFVLSLFMPAYVNEADIKQTLRGIIDTAKKYRVSLIGGNISKSSEFSISATIIGDYKDKHVVRRFSSKKGEQIYVSGELGNSWMAFYLNSNKDYIFKNYPNLGLEDKKLIENFINKHKLPEPRINLGRKLSEKKLACSLTDISDGLVKDIFNVIGYGCGCEIYLDEIPLNEELKYICTILNIEDYIDKAVSFGEDYELLWTSKKNKEKELLALSKTSGVKINKIGYINDKPACVIFLKNGDPYIPQDFTYKHL